MLTRFSTLLAFCIVTLFLTGVFLFGDSLPRPAHPPPVPDAAVVLEPSGKDPARTASRLSGTASQSSRVASASSEAALATPSLFVDLFPPGQKPPAVESLRPGLLPPQRPPTEPIQIAITESSGSHDEVIASLVHAFGSANGAQLHLYQLVQRYGIERLLSSFELFGNHTEAQLQHAFLKEDAITPDIVVAATCELDIIQYSWRFEKLLADGKTFLFCVVQQPERWVVPWLHDAVKPWVEAGMVEFITLSPRIAEFFQNKTIPEWKTRATPPVRSFIPVFPLTLPEHGASDQELSFALQGNYEASDRDYNTILTHLSAYLNLTSNNPPSVSEAFREWLKTQSGTDHGSKNVTLRLVGHGAHPTVPAALQHNVVFADNLNFTDYYAALSRAFALLPGLNASNADFLSHSTVPSVPAALIAGTPLIASNALLDAYGYLRTAGGDQEQAVWLKNEAETEMDVVERALVAGEEGRKNRRANVRKLCEELVKKNKVVVNEWVERARDKIKRNMGKAAVS